MTIISIVVPIYKGKKYIPKLINMLEKNNEVLNAKKKIYEIELVLVNDYPEEKLSTNNYHSNILIIYITNDKNIGIHASRIKGLENSNGKYILFLDQDDEISNIFLERQINKLDCNDAVVCNGKNMGMNIYKNNFEMQTILDIKHYENGINKIVSPGQVLLKRNAIPILWQENIIYNNGADDYFLWMLMLLERKKIVLNEEILFIHKTTGENTSNNLKQMKTSISEVLNVLKNKKYLSEKICQQIITVKDKEIDEIQKIDYKYIRNTHYMRILDLWMTQKENGITMSEYLEKEGIQSVAIYGAGMLGRHLLSELNKINISVLYYLDKENKCNFEGILKKEIGDEMIGIDTIIVTPICEYLEIKNILERYYTCKILSLKAIIENMDTDIL